MDHSVEESHPYNIAASSTYILNYAANLALKNVATQILRYLLFDMANLLTAVSTIYSASRIYTARRSSKGLQDLLQNFITKAKWNGPFITFIMDVPLVQHFFGWCSLFSYSSPLFSSGNMLFLVLHGAVYFMTLCKWLEYCALSNIAVVISILVDKRRSEAFSSSSKLIKGRRIRGLFFMLVYTVWRLSLGLPPLFESWNFRTGISCAVPDSSILCVRKVMNWVVFVVYYHDCKNRQGQKIIL